MAEHSSIAFQVMNERRKQGELCDFNIKVQRRIFPVHRLVLDSCSEYFRSMFASNMKESILGFCVLHDIEAETVEICIEFMYTGELEIDAYMAVKVLELAHMWHLNEAVKICEKVLYNNLDIACCFLYRRLANLYELDDLLGRCDKFIFSNIVAVVKYSPEIPDISFVEMKSLLQAWKRHCNTRDREISQRTIQMQSRHWPIGNIETTSTAEQLLNTKQSNLEFWNLCSRWSECVYDLPQICKIIQQFQIDKLRVQDFISTVWQDKHVKQCEKCKETVCKKLLKSRDTFQEISYANCLYLKHLANVYECHEIKPDLTAYIIRNFKIISTKSRFNALVPPSDFMTYTKCFKHWKSYEKFSLIASWIRFSSEREIFFPIIIKEMSMNFKNSRSPFKLQDAMFIKTLSQRYSCDEVHKEAVEFIVEHFSEIIKLPESLQIKSTDLILYLQKLECYGRNPAEIWEFILKWLNHDCEQRNKQFPSVFQALDLKKFSFTFVKTTISTCAVVKKSCECTSHLLNFTMLEVEEGRKEREQMKRHEEVINREQTIMNNKISRLDGRLRNIERNPTYSLFWPQNGLIQVLFVILALFILIHLFSNCDTVWLIVFLVTTAVSYLLFIKERSHTNGRD